MRPSDAVRVVIVGGGCAGIAAAWQLARLNDERENALVEARRQGGRQAVRRIEAEWPRYRITVCESSWRLGGKGASVRDQNGRILEHGLHIWLGFYENAFRMMRECFDSLAPDDRAGPQALAVSSFEAAFEPEPHIGVASRRVSGEWQVWSGFLPPMKGQPGTPLDEGSNPFTWWGYLARAAALARALMQSVLASAADPALQPTASDGKGRSALDEAVELDFSFDPLDSPEVVVERMARLLRVGFLGTAAGVLQGATLLETWLRERNPLPNADSTVLSFIQALAAQTRRQLRDVVMIDEELRRKTEIIDLLMAIATGLYADRVIFSDRGLDSIDAIDYRDWLLKHGATRGAVDSPLVRGIYDFLFAYRDGRHEQPALSAAQALRGAMRMFFTYRGSMFWRLRAGMGDSVFAPLYRALKTKGVEFRFREQLCSIEADSERIVAVDFKRTSDATDAADAAHPDALLHGCWPDEPRSPIESGPARRSRLVADTDFDAIVFATGIDAFFHAFSDDEAVRKARIDALPPAWRHAREFVKTIGTVSAQVWLADELEELGWQRGPVIVTGLGGDDTVRTRRAGRPRQRGFETWADMTPTLAAERDYRQRAGQAARDDKVRSIAYFCGVLRKPAKGARRDDQPAAVELLKTLLHQEMRPLWPAAYDGTGPKQRRTPADALLAPDGRADGTIADQHVRINDGIDDRYTLSLPGSAAYRISPLDPGFANMTVAGDWTDCGFNGGCVEAAVISGMLAAHAVSGRIDLDSIVGFHHP